MTAVLLAALLASCSSSTGSPASPSAAAAPAQALSPSTLEQQMHARVNAHRAAIGLPALSWHGGIADIARGHSANMAGGAVPFGHDGFAARVLAVALILRVADASENLAMVSGYADPVAAVFQGWLDSPTHRPNVEGTFGQTGIGVAISPSGTVYFTQIFVRTW
ncbi:MAG TPA: CAP domain-containing protein [Vicinamibacterales bacterium]|nr:CAP domain-containing protein [Vicinamibacterales bacterium]